VNAIAMPAAFDDTGPIDEMVIVTSARVAEAMGQPLRTKLGVFIMGTSGACAKRFGIDTGDELAAIIKTYAPPRASVAGTDAEHEVTEPLRHAVRMLMSLRSEGSA
jgi:hypothetical protein